MLVVSLVLGAIAAVLLLPLVSDLVSLAVARRRDAAGAGDAAAEPPALVFLVPAHDEELLIANTIASLRAMDYPAHRREVVVIADNCTDGTADAARAAGAHVLERDDPSRRGKPHALAWALAAIAGRAYDAVVVIDADAIVDAGFARALAAAGPLRGRAFQTYNDVRNRAENALTRMAAVFSRVRTVHMNGVKHRAGLTVPMANGLALGRDVVDRWGWTAFSICEDWEMYVLLTERGVPIASVPGARVFAQEARSLKQSASQRRRWAAGKITVLRDRLPALLRSTASWRQKLDVVAELTSVGPAVHAGAVALLVAVTLLLDPPGAAWLAGALLLSLARLATYTLLAIAADPQPARTALAFAYLPFYTLWRLAVQLGALRMLGDKPWIRTERHAAAEGDPPTSTPARSTPW